MNLITIYSLYPDQEACIEHLEDVRWHDEASCPYCGSLNVGRKVEKHRIGRWNCRDCKSSFNVLSGTIFEKTKIELQRWFLAVGLIVNAKKSLSSYQLARDLDLNQKSAWYMQQRIRAAMAAEQAPLLQGIVEADEAYIGGKPRKRNKRSDDGPGAPRGRGTKKLPVIGAVERGGNVTARVATDLSGKGILRFVKDTIDPAGTLLITDEYRGYNAVRGHVRHAVINHSVAYADGATHTNTIEGFWSLLKRAWYGSHHHYSRPYSPLFIAEANWKYNHRKDSDGFGSFMRGCFA